MFGFPPASKAAADVISACLARQLLTQGCSTPHTLLSDGCPPAGLQRKSLSLPAALQVLPLYLLVFSNPRECLEQTSALLIAIKMLHAFLLNK